MKITGRILFGLPLALFGILHFVMAGMMAGMVPSFLPGGALWVYITGLALILAALAVIANRMVGLAGVLLGIMLLGFVCTVHLPALLGGDQAAMSNLLKDTSMAGAAFYFAGTWNKGLFEM